MLKLLSIIFTALLLCSCAAHTQRIVVPSKKFSMIGPPSDWKTLIKTELAEFPEELHVKIPGGFFTALWSKNNLSKIGFIAAQIPESKGAIQLEATGNILPQSLRHGFNKDIEQLKLTECRKNLEYTIDSQRYRYLDPGIKLHELEASITCVAPRTKSFLKILMYMFYQDEYLYSFELISLQSDFDRNRKVLDAMIDSFTFMDQAPEKSTGSAVTSVEKPDELREEDQPAEKRFIKIQEPDVVFAYGKVKYTVNVDDTLEVIRTKTCRSGSGKCWVVKNVSTGETGIVNAKHMQLRSHIIYYAQQPDLDSLPFRAPPRITYIEILQPDKVYKGGKLSFTVTAGDTLEVLQAKICRTGGERCWAVRNVKTGKFGYVKADRMRSVHRVYSDLERLCNPKRPSNFVVMASIYMIINYLMNEFLKPSLVYPFLISEQKPTNIW